MIWRDQRGFFEQGKFGNPISERQYAINMARPFSGHGTPCSGKSLSEDSDSWRVAKEG